MYLVNKGFANGQISASKGKVIDIKDKSLATALESAGFVTPYSEKAISNKQMQKTIKDLTKQLNDKDSEIQILSDRIAELEKELNTSLDDAIDDNESDKNDEEKDSNLDENKDLTPNEDDEENGEESNEDNLDDKKSSKK